MDKIILTMLYSPDKLVKEREVVKKDKTQGFKIYDIKLKDVDDEDQF